MELAALGDDAHPAAAIATQLTSAASKRRRDVIDDRA
jgi:hypothetical protein